MDAAHLHLLLNHVPVLGAIFGLLLLAFAVWRDRDESTRVSLVVLAIVGLASIVVYLTGEPAEELIEGLPGFSEPLMEAHEEAALIATIAAALTGALATVGLWMYRDRPVPGWFRGLSLALAAIVVALMAWTANRGGQVRHTEVRTSAAEASDVRARAPSRAAPPQGREGHL